MAVLTVKYWVKPEADTTFTRQPMPSRFDFLPRVRMPSQFFRFPPSFRSTRARWPTLLTTTSTSPSLSRSPKAAPRPAQGWRKASPGTTLTKRPDSLRSSSGGCR